MEWYYIVLIVIASLLVVLSVCCFLILRGIFGREKDHKKNKISKDYIYLHNHINDILTRYDKLNQEKLTLNCSDGKKRRGYFVRNESSDVLVIFSHGWKSKGRINFGLTGEYALDNNYNILVVDHLGHGESDSNYLGFGIKDYYALIEWCSFIQEKENKEFKIFMHGVSMGSNTCLLCADKEVKGLKGIIADCGFTNAYDELMYAFKNTFHIPTFPALPLARISCKLFLKMDLMKYNTIDIVSKSKYPIYYIHGEKDNFVPTWMTLENEKVTTCPHQMWISKDCTHASTAFQCREEYEKNIVEFIEKYKNI